jgi:hypothetical protein
MSKIVTMVEAVDWMIREGEREMDDKFPPVTLTAVGFVIEDNDEYLAIATEMAEEAGMVRHVLTIPKSCIIQRQDLAGKV